MTVTTLSTIAFDELLDCFLLAFQNYFVEMPTDKNYYKKRWQAAKVDLSLSYGMFDEGKLVGFIIHAIDKRQGIPTAFNTGTGVIPAYRGKRIVKSIYAYALDDLKQHGIEKSTLEVITKNDIAIRCYKNVGFTITKQYKCYSGTIKNKDHYSLELKEIKLNDIDWKKLPNQQYYSWDHQKESILEGNYTFFYVLNHGEPESFFIGKPEHNYIAQFDLLNTENTGWERLFSAMKQVSGQIRVNNVDERLIHKINALRSNGLENSVDQYEMELVIKGNKTG